MKDSYRITTWILLLAATFSAPLFAAPSANPMFAKTNEPIDFAALTAEHITEYADAVLEQVEAQAVAIRGEDKPSFDNIIIPLDRIDRELSVASSHSWLLYWVSTDADTRDAGLEAYKQLDSWSVSLYSDKAIYDQIKAQVL